MDRRHFCRGAVAATVGSSFPFIAACERDLPPSPKVDTSIPAVSLDGATLSLERAAVQELADSLQGALLLSGHPEYDATRRIWNGMHDKRPALIARCLSEADVQQAVTFARERDLLLAVRGGGHSWPGKSVCDGGLMLDLSLMNTVRVDAQRRVAVARGGALLYNLDTAAREHGLITTAGVVSHTGVGGFTLGGGFGRLNRKFGLTIDNLLGASIVTADGQLRRAGPADDPELFWALRGGGGNFGVVTAFEYELHPFPLEVLSGNIVWPIDQAREVLRFYAEWHRGLSDDLYAGPVMATLPDGQSVVLMEIVYAGDPVQGEKELAPLLGIGKPLENGVRLNDYMMMQTQEDGTFAHGIRSYAKNGMVREFTRELADTLVDTFVQDPRLAFFTHTAGGAVARVDESATAFPHRNAQTMIIVAGAWTDPEHDADIMGRAREWFAALAPYTGGYYDNIAFEGDATAAANYGPAWSRLQRAKGTYDPGNLFRLNSNITPVS